MKQVFKCEKCGQEFDNVKDCARHEKECLNIDELLKSRFDEAIEELTHKFKIQINNHTIEHSINIYDGAIYHCHEKSTLKLVVETAESGLYIEKELDGIPTKLEIYNALYEAILPLFKTEYIGTLEDGYGVNEYILDGERIADIMERLVGRQIKIVVINN